MVPEKRCENPRCGRDILKRIQELFLGGPHVEANGNMGVVTADPPRDVSLNCCNAVMSVLCAQTFCGESLTTAIATTKVVPCTFRICECLAETYTELKCCEYTFETRQCCSCL